MRILNKTHIQLESSAFAYSKKLLVPLLCLLIASCSGGDKIQPAPPLGNDASLSSVSISGVTLDPVFSSSVTEYATSVLSGTTSVDVGATATDENASLTINGGVPTNVVLTVGENTIVILVTAEDGTTTLTYTVVITRPASSNANLSGLELTNIILAPPFDTNSFDYSATVEFFTTSTQVTATTEDVSANISVNGTAVNSGVASDSIPLDVGTNTITVNVTAADGTTTRTYTVLVVRQSAPAFAQKAYVKAFDPSQNDAFGAKLALSGDGAKLAVAAPFGGLEFCGEEPWVGRPQPVYEYERDDNGVWGELQKIVEFSAPHKIANVDFSADGSTLTVSARDLGLFVFSREGDGVWTQQKLDIQSPIASFYGFNMVALSADGATLAVVVSFSFPPSSIEALYIFTRDSDGNWTEQAEITDDKYFLNCCDFTPDISLSGDGATLAVSRLNRVYVFGRDNNNAWTERAELQQFSNDSEDNLLGDSVELSRDGTTLAAGATAAGSVYLFRTDSNNVWTEEAFVRPSVRATDQFGWSVALSADGAMLAVGAPFEDSGATGVNGDELNNDAIDSGAAWVFARDSFGVWTQRAYLKASTTLNTRHFGAAVSLSDDGTILAVGVPGDSRAATGVNGDSIEFGPGCAGATYIFEL